MRWGYEADKSQSPRWFKILLEPDSQYARDFKGMADAGTSPGIPENAIQSTVEYLERLWSHIEDDIMIRIQNDQFRPRIVLAIPAMWSEGD